jgi:hypothetical protein
MIRRIVAVGVVACALIASRASAGDPPRVGVASDSGDDAPRVRLVDELTAQGFDVRDSDKEDHGSVGRGSGLSAHLIVRARRIEVRVARRKGEQFELREAVIDLGPSEETAATATMRAVEFLRASLIEVGAAPPAAKPAPEPIASGTTPSLAERTRTPASRERENGMSFGLGAGVLHSTGGMPSNAVFVPTIAFPVSQQTGLRLLVGIPVSSAGIAGPEGDASVRPTLFALSGTWTPVRSEWVSPYVEAGIAAAFVSIMAHPAPGYQARDETPVSAIPFLGAGLSILPGRVRVRLGAVTGPGLRREHVRFAERDVAHWGGWVSAGMATLEVVVD